MAKGDRKVVQNSIDKNRDSGNAGNKKQSDIIGNQQQTMWDNYLKSQSPDSGYGQLLSGMPNAGADTRSGYANFANGGNNYSFDPQFRQSLDSALSGYQDFANTGGFSEQDKNDLRARAIAPTRAVYANAQSGIDRQRSLQGGYSPNYTAATSKMSRDLASGLSDTSTNANAQIAQMVQSGKLAGLGGLTQGSTAGQGLQNNINSLNSSQMLAGLGGMSDVDKMRISGILSGLGGQAQANSMYGNQALNSTGQALQGQQQANNFGLSSVGQQIQQTQMPSNYQQALGNIGGAIGIGGQVAGMASGLGGLFGGSTATGNGLPGFNNSGRY